MKSNKIENVEQYSGNLGNIAESIIKNNEIPKNTILLNKDIMPSKGKFYPNDIYIKKLTSTELKNLSTVTETNVNNVFNTVLSKNVIGVDVNDIMLNDKIWFIFYLRSVTYNDLKYKIKYHCDECGTNDTYDTSFNDIKVNYISDDIENTIEMDDNTKLEVGYTTIGDETQCLQISKNNDMLVEAVDEDMLLFATKLKKINGEKISLMKAYDYIINMDGMTFAKFAHFVDRVEFGIKPYLEIDCKCGAKVHTNLVYSADFFIPKIV